MLWQKSATELSQGLKAGTYSSTEVVASVLDRVAEANPGLNALVYEYADAARDQARAADEVLARAEPVGPLHGVPVTVKINVDLEGTPTDNGLTALAGHAAPGNSAVVQNLIDAGAIIIGKTNAPELSMRATTDNPLHGPTHNPWAERASPGGSSGGAGSACAAGMAPIHHGNDIGGSLRFPASACGCYTVKPGLGRVPAFNPSATAERGLLAQLMSVQGVICRTVDDVRLGTRVLARGDARDPWWVPAPFDGPRVDAPVRVAVTTESHGYPMHPEVAQSVHRAATALEDAGYAVEEVDVPSVMEAARAWFSVAILEIKETLDPIAREHGSDTVQRVFDYYYDISNMVDHAGYMAGVAERTRIVRAWSAFLDRYPLVLTPFLMRPLYNLDHDETLAGAKDIFDASVYSYSMNYMGLPAGNAPVGTAGGRPCGVQIVGQRFREDLILDAMAVIERAVPPSFPWAS